MRPLPHDLSTERAYLLALMSDGERVMADAPLEPEHFYSKPHQYLMEVCLSLYNRGQAIDFTVVQSEMKEQYMSDLSNVLQADGMALMSRQYAEIIKDRWQRRLLIGEATKVATLAYQTEESVEELTTSAVKTLSGMGNDSRIRHIAEVLDEVEPTLGVPMPGLPTGYREIDRVTGGLKPGNLCLLAARPSVGKTALAGCIAGHVATTDPVLFFSLEQSRTEIAHRMISAATGYESAKLHRYHNGAMEKVRDRLKDMRKLSYYIDDTAALSWTKMRQRAKRLHMKHKLGLVVVDYIQIMGATDPKQRRYDQITESSQGLKQMAKELDCPVIALSQLSRASESEGRRPQLHDLRESGALEQDADVIMMLYRELKPDEIPDGVQVDEADLENMAICNIAKNRNGATGRTLLRFNRKLTRYEDLAIQPLPAHETGLCGAYRAKERAL